MRTDQVCKEEAVKENPRQEAVSVMTGAEEADFSYMWLEKMNE